MKFYPCTVFCFELLSMFITGVAFSFSSTISLDSGNCKNSVLVCSEHQCSVLSCDQIHDKTNKQQKNDNSNLTKTAMVLKMKALAIERNY